MTAKGTDKPAAKKTSKPVVKELTPLEQVNAAIKYLQNNQFYTRGVNSRSILTNLYAAQKGLQRALG